MMLSQGPPVSGNQFRLARERLRLTQQQAAKRWKMSQTYISLVESGKRRVPGRVVRQLVRAQPALATVLPLKVPSTKPEDLPVLFGALGYPGFAHLAKPSAFANPAALAVAALRASPLPGRVAEALPWLFVAFPDLDWSWLVDQAKLSNAQNRLGYFVAMARRVAAESAHADVASSLAAVERTLDEARLVREDTLGRSLTEAERVYLREHRSPEASHWNVLTTLTPEHLRDVG
jgi:transcriptional regulator with XRE-family HTH domain